MSLLGWLAVGAAAWAAVFLVMLGALVAAEKGDRALGEMVRDFHRGNR